MSNPDDLKAELLMGSQKPAFDLRTRAYDVITALESRVAELEATLQHWRMVWDAEHYDLTAIAEEARNKALEDGLARAARVRATFCLASPGSDEEIAAWLHGFDAAILAMKEKTDE